MATSIPFYKTKSFKTAKNMLFGVGAAVVIIGAWAKILHFSWASYALTAGLLTEAFIFFISGVIPPEPDYYWEKYYPVWISMIQMPLLLVLRLLLQVQEKNHFLLKWIKCSKRLKLTKTWCPDLAIT